MGANQCYLKFLISSNYIFFFFLIYFVVQVRIPTSYDKPGTSQLVQSAQVNTLK